MISLQLGKECWGGGLAVRWACMCGLGLSVRLGVGGMVYTINKCIWDLPSSKGGAGACPHALAFSPSVVVNASSRWSLLLSCFLLLRP